MIQHTIGHWGTRWHLGTFTFRFNLHNCMKKTNNDCKRPSVENLVVSDGKWSLQVGHKAYWNRSLFLWVAVVAFCFSPEHCFARNSQVDLWWWTILLPCLFFNSDVVEHDVVYINKLNFASRPVTAAWQVLRCISFAINLASTSIVIILIQTFNQT